MSTNTTQIIRAKTILLCLTSKLFQHSSLPVGQNSWLSNFSIETRIKLHERTTDASTRSVTFNKDGCSKSIRFNKVECIPVARDETAEELSLKCASIIISSHPTVGWWWM